MTARPASEPCWTGECDGCDEALGDGEGTTWHFDTRRELEERARDIEWSVTEAGLFCETCSATRACADLGHRDVEQVGDSWYCGRCDERVDPPVAPAPPTLRSVR